MMKRIAISLVCPLIGALLMTSCLDGDDTVLSSDVALLSFEIEDLKTKRTILKDDGTDSTYTTIVSGATVEFVIDQTARLVYNTDSLDYGTDVTGVLVDVMASGGVYYLKPDGEAGGVSDSIDFTHPVTFRVTSYDKQFERDYVVSINVHQVDPKKTIWKQVDGANFPILNNQKAFVKGDSLYVIGTGGGVEFRFFLREYRNFRRSGGDILCLWSAIMETKTGTQRIFTFVEPVPCCKRRLLI